MWGSRSISGAPPLGGLRALGDERLKDRVAAFEPDCASYCEAWLCVSLRTKPATHCFFCQALEI